MRSAWCGLAMLALAGCDRAADPPPETRPDWRGATIDGLAPLMSPGAVRDALRRQGYALSPCVPDDPVDPNALFRGTGSPCYRDRTRGTRVSLYFLELHEGRRLAVVNFHYDHASDTTQATSTATGEAIARRLRAKLGPPSITTREGEWHSEYWARPGGQRSLPDTISTTVGGYFGGNATMTSMWAYGQQRAPS